MTPLAIIVLLACWWLPPLALALGLSMAGRARIQWGWFVAAMAAYAIYALAGYWTLPSDIGALPAEARWTSRAAQLVAGAAMIALLWKRHPLLDCKGLGLTLRQAPGSLPWSIAGIAALVALGLLSGGFDGGSAATPGPLAWLYHLTLPGIEEELVYRGLLFALLTASLGKTDRISPWAAAMATLVFALAHGVTPSPDGINLNPVMIGYTLVAGAILAAMRLRSGSLLLPAVGHNLIGLVMRLA